MCYSTNAYIQLKWNSTSSCSSALNLNSSHSWATIIVVINIFTHCWGDIYQLSMIQLKLLCWIDGLIGKSGNMVTKKPESWNIRNSNESAFSISTSSHPHFFSAVPQLFYKLLPIIICISSSAKWIVRDVFKGMISNTALSSIADIHIHTFAAYSWEPGFCRTSNRKKKLWTWPKNLIQNVLCFSRGIFLVVISNRWILPRRATAIAYILFNHKDKSPISWFYVTNIANFDQNYPIRLCDFQHTNTITYQ